MPKCKINGIEVEVAAGTTIIEAMKKLNQEVAHYCWHPGLSVAGVCRLCMVQIEGMPKLQIACNTEVKDGMVINNTSEQVKDAVRWGLDFHLINHPLDCPICDQAGECGLQDQYMQFGKYDPEMAEPKVKKHKVVDLGSKIVLDSERCILCSRCVRFTDEVSKTHELGIFNRGDRSEIGTFDGKPLENNYALNTVDVCPVGALTSKDFRFRQRVWYLKDLDTICTGCSTGCSVKVYFNEEGAWRVRPRHNPEVNGYWMCDKGRDVYRFVNAKGRIQSAQVRTGGSAYVLDSKKAAHQVGLQARERLRADKKSVALVLTGQYSNEEYETLLDAFVNQLECRSIYHWVNNPDSFDDFDGLLIRGDKNPNTKGLLAALKKFKTVESWDSLVKDLESGTIQTLFVAGPEIQSVYPDMAAKIEMFAKARSLVWMAPGSHPSLESPSMTVTQIPVKTFFEKVGTYTNFQGREQRTKIGREIIPAALSLTEIAQALVASPSQTKGSQDCHPRGELKQNHFTGIRGPL